MVSGFDPLQATMATQLQPTALPLVPIGGKAVDLDFDGGRLSSDAGVVLLKDIDAQLGFTRNLAAVLSDPRDPRRINFTLEDLIKQRVFQIAAGYEDANDANTLRDDPIFKLIEFIPLSFWYDAPLRSRDSDRRHDPCLVYRRSARPPSNIGQQPIRT
jgi:hypothetical protein